MTLPEWLAANDDTTRLHRDSLSSLKIYIDEKTREIPELQELLAKKNLPQSEHYSYHKRLKETNDDLNDARIKLLAFNQEPIPGWIDINYIKIVLAAYAERLSTPGVALLTRVPPHTYLALAQSPDVTVTGHTVGLRFGEKRVRVNDHASLPEDGLRIISANEKQPFTLMHIPPTFVTELPGGPELYHHTRQEGLDWPDAILTVTDTLGSSKPAWIDDWFDEGTSRQWYNLIHLAASRGGESMQEVTELLEDQQKAQQSGDWQKALKQQTKMTHALNDALEQWAIWSYLRTPPAEPNFNLAGTWTQATRLVEQGDGNVLLHAHPAVYAHLAKQTPGVRGEADVTLLGQKLLRLDINVPPDALEVVNSITKTRQKAYLPPARLTIGEGEAYKQNRGQGLAPDKAETLAKDTLAWQGRTIPTPTAIKKPGHHH